MRLTSPLLPRTSSDVSTTAMVILNTPIAKPPSTIFEKLWESSTFHICADGGANRLYEATKDVGNDNHHHHYHHNNNHIPYIPNVIRGDLDSLQPHVREYYASKHVLIEKDPCQDNNDLDKALQKIVDPSIKCDQVIVYGAFGGRFDQEMASFQALYKWADTFQYRMWLYSDETSAVLVPSGQKVEIHVPHHHPSLTDDSLSSSSTATAIREGPTCGLIPLGSKVDCITTSGLQWNLEQAETEFGGLLSSSNHILGDFVTVESSHPIIFTAEVATCTRYKECNFIPPGWDFTGYSCKEVMGTALHFSKVLYCHPGEVHC